MWTNDYCFAYVMDFNLEFCGLTRNITSFTYLLKKVDFDAVLDHLALTNIIKSKAETSKTRKKLP